MASALDVSSFTSEFVAQVSFSQTHEACADLLPSLRTASSCQSSRFFLSPEAVSALLPSAHRLLPSTLSRTGDDFGHHLPSFAIAASVSLSSSALTSPELVHLLYDYAPPTHGGLVAWLVDSSSLLILSSCALAQATQYSC